MSPKRSPKKVLRCRHCKKKIGDESVTISYRCRTEEHSVVFCKADCMVEYLYDEQIQAEIDEKVRTEQNWLHKQVCPACRRRIM